MTFVVFLNVDLFTHFPGKSTIWLLGCCLIVSNCWSLANLLTVGHLCKSHLAERNLQLSPVVRALLHNRSQLSLIWLLPLATTASASKLEYRAIGHVTSDRPQVLKYQEGLGDQRQNRTQLSYTATLHFCLCLDAKYQTLSKTRRSFFRSSATVHRTSLQNAGMHRQLSGLQAESSTNCKKAKPFPRARMVLNTLHLFTNRWKMMPLGDFESLTPTMARFRIWAGSHVTGSAR